MKKTESKKHELKLNTRVIIRQELKDGFEVYQSRIEDLTEQYVCLAMPTRGGEVVPLQVGEKIEVNFTMDDGLYLFKGPVLKRERNPVPMILLNRPRKIKRQQRRQYVRVETCIPAWLRRLSGSEYLDLYEKNIPGINHKMTPPSELSASMDEGEPTVTQGVVHNISGGGMLMVSPQKFKIDEILKLRFSLAEGQARVEIVTKVVRSYELSEEDTSYPFSLGLEFVEVDPKVRHKIVRYTFTRQIQLSKKGLAK